MDKILPMSNNNFPNLLLVIVGTFVGVLVALLLLVVLLPNTRSESGLGFSVVVLYQIDLDLGLFDLCCECLLIVDVNDVFMGDDDDEAGTFAW